MRVDGCAGAGTDELGTGAVDGAGAGGTFETTGRLPQPVTIQEKSATVAAKKNCGVRRRQLGFTPAPTSLLACPSVFAGRRSRPGDSRLDLIRSGGQAFGSGP